VYPEAVTLGYRYILVQSPTLFGFCTMQCSCDHKKQNQKLLHTLLHPTLLVLLHCYNGCSRSSLPQPLYLDHKLTLKRQIHGQNYLHWVRPLWFMALFPIHIPFPSLSWDLVPRLVGVFHVCLCLLVFVCVCPQASRMQADVRYGNIPHFASVSCL